MKRDLVVALAVCTVSALGLVELFELTGARELEERAQAALLRGVGSRPLSDQVVIIARDDLWRERRAASVSRKLLARMTLALHHAGAKAVLFDAVMSTAAFDGPDADTAFAAALKETGAALAVACETRGAADESPRGLVASTLPDGPLSPERCATPILPSFVDAHDVTLGNIAVSTSESGLIREVTLLATVPGGRSLPSLALLALLPQVDRHPPRIAELPTGLVVAGKPISTTEDATRLVSARRPADVISLVDVEAALGADGTTFTDPRLLERVRGRYVFYGITAEESRDWGTIINGETRPLVEIHAALLSDLLEGRALKEASLSVRLLCSVIFALLLCLAVFALRPPVAVLALLMGLCAWVGVLTKAGREDLLLPIASPAASAIGGLGISLYLRLRRREREQSLLQSAFADYVDPTVMKTLLDAPEKHLALAGMRKEVTVLFVDLVGYTRMTNALPAEQSLAILRDHVQRVTQIIKRAGGRIDKIIGDGVMAVFNDPVPLHDHAHVAVRVAGELHAAVAAAPSGLKVRVGIATGDAFVGNIGAAGAKIEYTVLGATVNLAARLEGQAPPGGTMVSDATFNAARTPEGFELMESLALKGFDNPVRAYRSPTPTPGDYC